MKVELILELHCDFEKVNNLAVLLIVTSFPPTASVEPNLLEFYSLVLLTSGFLFFEMFSESSIVSFDMNKSDYLTWECPIKTSCL